jgi:hypothetical protein
MTGIIENAVIPLVAIVFVCGLPVAAFVFSRVLSHRERMAMIAHGIAPGTADRMPPGLKPSGDASENAQVTLKKGIRLAFIGLAITIGLSFLGFHGDGVWQPGPWLLAGLMPLFIGIAQVLIALISGATFGPNFSRPQGPASQPAPFAPPPTEPPPANPISFDSPYTYRPGTTEQLRPPSTPPERL